MKMTVKIKKTAKFNQQTFVKKLKNDDKLIF